MTPEQDAILSLLHRHYEAIVPLEAAWNIQFKEGDMRPRVEYFHDAVRAFTSGVDVHAKHSRLSVEHLAYDIANLRRIQEKPLGSAHKGTQKATTQALVKHGVGSGGGTAPASVRSELQQHYREYTLYFVALLAPMADRNFKTRTDSIDASVSDIGLIETVLEQLAAGRITQTQAAQALGEVEYDELRERLQHMLASKKLGAREKADAKAMLGVVEKGLAKEKAALNAAHLQVATGQLAVYQEGRDMVKKLATSGLNLAGKYLANAMQAANAGKGRGV
jgi:hypothetical protein